MSRIRHTVVASFRAPALCAFLVATSVRCSSTVPVVTAAQAHEDPLADQVRSSVARVAGSFRECYLGSRMAGKDVSVEIDYRISTLGHAVHVSVAASPASRELEQCERRVIESAAQPVGTIGIDVQLVEQHASIADSEPTIAVFRNAPPQPDPTLEPDRRPLFVSPY